MFRATFLLENLESCGITRLELTINSSNNNELKDEVDAEIEKVSHTIQSQSCRCICFGNDVRPENSCEEKFLGVQNDLKLENS